MSAENKALLQKYIRTFQPLSQFVLLTEDGQVKSSSDTIVSLIDYQNKSIFLEIPFLESIQEVLQGMTAGDNPLIFPRMEFPILEQEGVFDFVFRRFDADGDESYIGWDIVENSEHYQYLYEVQQERNDAMIHGEHLDLENKYIKALYEQIQEQNNEILLQKDIIEDKNKKLMDSIYYASRIQNALIPPVETIQEYLKDSFILYLPRDVVSGDFYWFAHDEDSCILAIVDCTGHGVPGAFMAVLGSSSLNQIINIDKVKEPAQILTILDTKVKTLLNPEDNHHEEIIEDGMDVSLCKIDFKKGVLSYAGAKRPLFYFQNDTMMEVKGDRFPIGGLLDKQKSFHQTDIPLLKGSTFYIFSDGYADQFGGANDKKFMIAQMKEIMNKAYNLPFDQQEKMYREAHEIWKEGHKQTDDVLLVGFGF